ncbi:MAG: glycosyltransferase [Pseudarcicella sp.]|nr:glycosyltransferase [Pseudarcicella sp.]MBP6410948.1 glycosyltransferase [Pseudarcicella sp.]
MKAQENLNIKILIPVYNDWESLLLLMSKIRQTLSPIYFNHCTFVIVDDCSTIEADIVDFESFPTSIVRLRRNVSHQKAIALGLSYIVEKLDFSMIIVMDSDGEDKPEDLVRMIEKSYENPNQIIFAKRSKRSESSVFKLFYFFYKLLFSVFTGKIIEFGNFSLIPAKIAKKVVYVSEIWNHFSGGIVLSKFPHVSIDTARGTRLAGKSKMNFVSLILHGMSAISVHLETVAVRIFVGTLVISFFASVIVSIAIYMKLNIVGGASPGWTTTLITSSVIIVLQAVLSSLFLLFTVLNYRTHKHFIPAKDYHDFIEKVEVSSLVSL